MISQKGTCSEYNLFSCLNTQLFHNSKKQNKQTKTKRKTYLGVQISKRSKGVSLFSITDLKD